MPISRPPRRCGRATPIAAVPRDRDLAAVVAVAGVAAAAPSTASGRVRRERALLSRRVAVVVLAAAVMVGSSVDLGGPGNERADRVAVAAATARNGIDRASRRRVSARTRGRGCRCRTCPGGCGSSCPGRRCSGPAAAKWRRSSRCRRCRPDATGSAPVCRRSSRLVDGRHHPRSARSVRAADGASCRCRRSTCGFRCRCARWSSAATKMPGEPCAASSSSRSTSSRRSRAAHHEIWRAARCGTAAALVYFLDDRSFPEPQAFWVGGARDASGRRCSPTRPRAAVRRCCCGMRRWTTGSSLQAGDWTRVLTDGAGRGTARARFPSTPARAPAAADRGRLGIPSIGSREPASRDQRFLGVWVKVEED